MQNLQYLKGRP